jgi:hypothetical protein
MRRERGPRHTLTRIFALSGGTSRKTYRFLIDTMAIRIHPNSFRIITNSTSNRHTSGPHPFDFDFSPFCPAIFVECVGRCRPSIKSIQISTRHIPIVEFAASPAISMTSDFLLVTHSHFSASWGSHTSRKWNHTAAPLLCDPAAALTPVAPPWYSEAPDVAAASNPRPAESLARRSDFRTPVESTVRLRSPQVGLPKPEMSPTEEYAWPRL